MRYKKGDRVYWDITGMALPEDAKQATFLGYASDEGFATILIDGAEESIEVHDSRLRMVPGVPSGGYVSATGVYPDLGGSRLTAEAMADLKRKVRETMKRPMLSPILTSDAQLTEEEIANLRAKWNRFMEGDQGPVYVVKPGPFPKIAPMTEFLGMHEYSNKIGIHVEPYASDPGFKVAVHSLSEEMSRQDLPKTKKAPFWMEGYANILGLIRLILFGKDGDEHAQVARHQLISALATWFWTMFALVASFALGYLLGSGQ